MAMGYQGAARPEHAGARYLGVGARLLGSLLLLVVWAQHPACAGLAERLERGETVTIVAFGDSLAAGYELADPDRDAYPSIFASALQRRYPRARIRLIRAGIPGDTAWGGAGRLDRDVLTHGPDLVTVQFGGNDHFYQRPPDEFRRDLQAMVRSARRAGAAVLLATPPIVAPETDTPMVKAAKEAGQAEHVPVADFDGAIRRRGTGPRGPFPLRRHPDAYLHAVMAREMYRAFLDLVPEGGRLRVSIAGGVHVVPRADEARVEVEVDAPAGAPVVVMLESEGERRQQTVEPDAEGHAVARFAVPLGPWDGRHRRRRLLAWARSGGETAGAGGAGFDYDLRWLTTAPVLRLGDTATLGGPGIIVGGRGWVGPADLSGQVKAARDGDQLHLEIVVIDDRLARSSSADAFESDCVEVFLDARDGAAQARPYWDDGVAGLFLRPGTLGTPEASWTPLDPLPEAWRALAVRSALEDGGYRVDLRLPLSLFPDRENPGGRYPGFDVALDDADDGRGRRTQMMWAGGADDFLDPSLFGALDLAPEADGEPQMRVCVW